MAFPLAKALLFHNNWPPLVKKVVSTCPATGRANVNGSEPLAIPAGSARAVRELLVNWPWAVMLKKLDCWQNGVDSTIPAESMIAKLVPNCRLMRAVNTIWMMNVIRMFGFVAVVEGKAPVELSEPGAVAEELSDDVDGGVVNETVLARLAMDEDKAIVEDVLEIPDSEIDPVEELRPLMSADDEVAKLEV